MSVVTYAPNTMPTLSANWPNSPSDYPSDNTPDFGFWIGSGGPSGLAPSPDYYLAVADLPATVESRQDYAHHVNSLVYVATGGETSVTLNLEAPLTLSSGYLSLQPIVTSADAASYQLGSENGGQILASLHAAMSYSGGVFSAVLNGGGTWLANGHYFTFGSCPDAPQLEGLKILIVSTTNTTGSTMTATFVGAAPADFSIVATHINYIVPANGVYNLTSFNLPPFNQGNGTVDYLTGVVTLPCSALSAGTKIYATYGTRHKNMGDFQIPWTNLSALAAGSGPATCTLTPMTYDAEYGSSVFNDSQWLVARNFGFNLPSNAVIKHVAFALEGGTVSSFSGEAGIQNLALVVGNQFQLPPFTQCVGDLSDDYYGDAGSNDYWGFLDLNWPGSTANDGSSEFTGSDLWDEDYFNCLTDPVSGTGFAPTGLTVAEVNNAGFGFGISGNYGDSVGSADVTVKSVRLMVWYEAAASNVDADTSTVTASPAEVLANGTTTSTITVTLRDSLGDPVAGQTVTLAGTGSSTISAASGPSDSNGIVTFSVSDTTAELDTYTATAGSVVIVQTASVQFVEAGHVNCTVYAQQGPVLAGAQVYVVQQPATTNTIPPSPLLPIYSDPDAQNAITQPLVTDGQGACDFYASAVLFTLMVVNNGTVQQTYVDQECGKPSASYHLIENWTKSALGPAVPGAQVFVVQNSYPNIPTTLARGFPNPQVRVFADNAGLIPVTQPSLSNGFGYTAVYAPAGVYTLVVYLNGSLQAVYPDVSVGGVYAGAMARYRGWAKNALGVAQSNQRVFVTLEPSNIPSALVPAFPTNLAPIFSDVNGFVPVEQSLKYDANNNPVILSLITDANGFYTFTIAPNTLFTIAVYNTHNKLGQLLLDQSL